MFEEEVRSAHLSEVLAGAAIKQVQIKTKYKILSLFCAWDDLIFKYNLACFGLH